MLGGAGLRREISGQGKEEADGKEEEDRWEWRRRGSWERREKAMNMKCVRWFLYNYLTTYSIHKKAWKETHQYDNCRSPRLPTVWHAVLEGGHDAPATSAHGWLALAHGVWVAVPLGTEDLQRHQVFLLTLLNSCDLPWGKNSSW